MKVLTFEEVLEAGRKNTSIEFKEPTPESVFMFSYTSGTTGNPKAVMLTHKMAVAVMTAGSKTMVTVTNNDVFISYLPLAHSME